MGGDEVKDSDVVIESSRSIARDTSESAYIWYTIRVVKTVLVDDGINGA